MKTLSNKPLAKSLSFLLVAEVAAAVIPVIVLGNVFHFPAILRQPADEAFKLFQLNHRTIIPSYYLFMMSSLLYIPLASLLKVHFGKNAKSAVWLDMTYISYIATAIFQSIGFSRWIFVMPYLTKLYINPETKAGSIALYEFMNRFLGMTVGEHLGFLTMGFGMVALSKAIPLNKFMTFSGIVIGVLIIISVFEHFGGAESPIFATVNILANSLWSIWILIVSILIWKTSNSIDAELAD